MGLSGVKVPPKPEALVLWQQCKALGLPLVSGGLVDQPHIWLIEIAVLLEEEELFSATVAAMNRNANDK